ncbi:alpha/beta-hydrolase, partial [Polychaeton citri CBS 116435]
SSTSSPTLLLIHFWGGTNQIFSPLIDHLSTTVTVVAPSFHGWGESTETNDDCASQDAYEIADYAEYIISLLLANGIIVLGHSMGSKIAYLVRGLIFVASAPAASFVLPDEMREQQIHAYDEIETAEFVIRNVLLGRPESVNGQVVEQIAREAVAGVQEAKRAWPAYGMGEVYGEDVVKTVQELAMQKVCKVLVVGGELDRVETAENVEKNVVKVLEGAGAKVEFNVLDGVGHLVPVEAAEKLAKTVERFVVQI